MNQTDKTRFVLIGGFLGAGKTTLIGQLARHYVAAGKRVGIITNDQADNLVDTHHLRSQGFEVGEVSGACFCCSFDDLVATANELSKIDPPDVFLAEPVGSCTDLVATVVLPLQELLGDRFELAPFGVLLKPSHGRRILAEGDSPRSGFSPQAEYIFRKQLEEADYLMIGRRDELSDEEMTALKQLVGRSAEDVPVIAVSPRTGEGVEEVVGYIESSMTPGRRLLEIDYDTYAIGEAELGWVNLSAMLQAPRPIDLDRIATELVGRIGTEIIDATAGHIAHLKASVLGGGAQAVANMVSNDSGVDVGLRAGQSADGEVQVIVNARVAMDPQQLEDICRQQCERLGSELEAELISVSAQSLRPGRPVPTHRVTR